MRLWGLWRDWVRAIRKVSKFTMIDSLKMWTEPWIVVDQYLTPISANDLSFHQLLKTLKEAKNQFKEAAFSVAGSRKEDVSELTHGNFHRYIGDAAIAKVIRVSN